ncbi:MAG TPA: endolytic transglycosylase MltG [Candidatus Paceibacterota bacterium]
MAYTPTPTSPFPRDSLSGRNVSPIYTFPWKSFLWRFFSVALAILIILFFYNTRPPKAFPSGFIFHIEKNTSLSDIADMLVKKRIIRSQFIFKASTVFFNLNLKDGVFAGEYLFQEPTNVWTTAYRMVKGDQGLPRIKISIPEGSTVDDIAFILQKEIPNFNAPYFVKVAKSAEGYLFPDTYFFYQNTTALEIVDSMRRTFDEKLQGLIFNIGLSRRKIEDIVTMASIIEKEASSTKDRMLIADVLWKRLDEGMLLQTDPTVLYITSNLNNGHVSIADTKIDSPYNTYKYKGLPKGPISNPSLDALKASINSTKNPYFYYLADKKGNMHYAVDYEGHLENKDKYLR